MGRKLATYGPAADHDSDASVATYMSEAFETADAGYIAHALGVVARAKGMSQMSKRVCPASNSIGRSAKPAIRR